jgi:hypothetical protein
VVKILINLRNIDRVHNFSLANRATARVTPHNPNHHIAKSSLLRLPYIAQTSKPALSHVSLSNKISLGVGQCRLKKFCEFFIFLIFCYEPNRSDSQIINFGYAATKPITPFLLIREALVVPCLQSMKKQLPLLYPRAFLRKQEQGRLCFGEAYIFVIRTKADQHQPQNNAKRAGIGYNLGPGKTAPNSEGNNRK